MNSSGQESTVFNLLVQAIIGLFILIIIVSAITYFEGQKFEISKQRFNENLVFASQQPNGDVLLIEDVAFNETSITKKYISLKTGIEEECIELYAKNPHIELNSDSVIFTESLVLNVYLKCSTSENCGVQGINCIVSFGKKLENDLIPQ